MTRDEGIRAQCLDAAVRLCATTGASVATVLRIAADFERWVVTGNEAPPE